jgi:threonine/homoserine/homoserine lactone efflux protein
MDGGPTWRSSRASPWGIPPALVLSLVGLGAVLAASATLFTAVKWAGGLYLIYLGSRMLRGGALPAARRRPWRVPLESHGRVFVNTWLVTALNPKGIIFFIAFLPQFLRRGADVAPQLWVFAVTFVVLATLNAALYAVFAASARRFLSSPKALRVFNFAGGSLLTPRACGRCSRAATALVNSAGITSRSALYVTRRIP